MNENKEIKDRLYYEDLIYAIKKIGNLDYTENKTTEERIALRLQPNYSEEEQKENELIGEELSDFELDLFLVIRNIGKKVGDSFKSIENIRKYPKLIKEELQELEQKKLEVSTLPFTTNPLFNDFKFNQVIREDQTERSYTVEDFSEDCKTTEKIREKSLW